MAPRKKKVNNDVKTIEITDSLMNMLHEISIDTTKNGFGYYPQSHIIALIESGLVELNYNMPNINDPSQFATRITQKGNDLINSKGNNITMAKKQVNISENETIGNFAVGTFDLSAVKAKAKSARRGRESKYHLDRLNVGEFIFVPCTPAHDSSDKIAKSLNGTIQAANKKFAEETGEYKTVSRKVKGSDERVEKQVAVTRAIRKFEVYGYNHGGVDGAAMVRVM